MELVQQYVLVRGKLQPAIKYLAPQPYYNKYLVKDRSRARESDQEVITYPSVNGDLTINERHNSYVDALSNKKGWGPGDYTSQYKSSLDHYVTQSQRAGSFDPNRETKRGNNGDLLEADSEGDEDLQDPRTVQDLEQENITLKE